MTLKQAFTQWAVTNTVLAANSRNAVQRVLLKEYEDMHLEAFTEAFCRRLFSESNELLELQVKAASILVHVLSWGGDNGYCKHPSFTYEIASEEHRKRLQGQQGQQVSSDECQEASEATDSVSAPENGEALETCNSKRKTNKTTMREEAKTPKKLRGQPPRPVVQIDPTTLEPVRQWPSMAEAASEIGCLPSNIHRSVTQLRSAGGFYWADVEDADKFKDMLAHKNATPHSQRAMKASINRGKRVSSDKYKVSSENTDSMSEEKAPKPTVKQPITKTTVLPASEPANTDARGPLDQYSDDELARELKRRGWHGELIKSLSV